ncbi:MORN repeat-containing protein 5 [Bombus vosnesenskii]|uniref:MORN repeat-containing protein 5 n=2 Tax=Pyrobombus TaxID=144703 RepID=A0A6J3JWH0_9HYME|nr:MORN repeat-containing protein 5 [Bombus vancouverensis nearcticus]XP_033306346.1 MORN repeat-containing protein 5 [Bombus bifarius]XP_033344646.1 MORN repeat-containing protein 5 [Bombus vosnesenskii]
MNVQSKNSGEETRFVDGSEYRGTWNVLGMEGIGKFVLPHNAIFEGEFRDGTFHGHGSLYFPRLQRIDGIWSQGECKDKRYTFNDGLIFRSHNWDYCRFPDRRYQTCIKHGLRPGGATLRTNDRNEFLIPPTCYDAGIGIFNPCKYHIVSHQDSKKVLEIPNTKFTRWIQKNCQKAWSEPTGNRKDLYENWFPDKFNTKFLSTLLPFSNESFEPWWKRLTTFRSDCKEKTLTNERNKHFQNLIESLVEFR